MYHRGSFIRVTLLFAVYFGVRRAPLDACVGSVVESPASGRTLLCNSLRISFVDFVTHGRQGHTCLRLIHANDVKAQRLQTKLKMLAQGTRFEADAINGVFKSFKARGNAFDFESQLSFKMDLAFAIDDAKRTGPKRHI